MDSPELTRQMDEHYEQMRKKSRTVHPDGTWVDGSGCPDLTLSPKKQRYYAVVKVITWLFRPLL